MAHRRDCDRHANRSTLAAVVSVQMDPIRLLIVTSDEKLFDGLALGVCRGRYRPFDHGEIQLTYRGNRYFPPTIGAQSANPSILVRQPCGIQAGCTHGFSQN